MTPVQIPSQLQSLIESRRADTPTLLKLLKPGQILSARVLEPTSNGVAKLVVGSTQLLAQTRAPLQANQALTLQVISGLPKPQLSILQNSQQPSEPHQDPARALLQQSLGKQLTPGEVQTAVRELIRARLFSPSKGAPSEPPSPPLNSPRRTPVAAESSLNRPAMANPLADASRPDPGLPTQAKPVHVTPDSVLKILLPKAGSAEQIEAKEIRKAFEQSGIFLEPKLAQGTPPIPTDRKLVLLQLLRLLQGEAQGPAAQEKAEQNPLRNNPADNLMQRLLRLVESSLARVQTHQANSLPSEDGNRQAWYFELPIQLGERQDFPQLRIQQEQDRNADDDQFKGTWKVDIEFAFDTLGKVFSRLNLTGDQVSAAFWCDNEPAADKIRRALPQLELALEKAGLKVTAAASLCGKPPVETTRIDALVDERA